MTYEKFRTQNETKNKNEEKILTALHEKPMKFTELRDITKLSPMGLTQILKRLLESKKIEKVIYKDKEAYKLTKKGLDYLKGMWMILNEIYEMQKAKTNYNSNYFSEDDIKWSLLRELESPLIKYNAFINKISNEYRELILMDIKERYIKENEDKTYSLINAEDLKGKHIIAFEIDFDLIRQNLEDALKSDSAFNDTVKTVKQGLTRRIKEYIRNQYRHVLFNEARKPIFNSQEDNEVDDQ
ncbi:MAG: hypothetical protein ACYDAO_00055 [Thermoplasmataceae archaeon]